MSKDITKLLEESQKESCHKSRRGVIINPGAIGDCLLTLPLANFMKQALNLSGVDFLGQTEYIDFYPGRTCVDSVRSVSSIDFHRLFVEPDELELEDGDPLIKTFCGYEWIVSFMGQGNRAFESNLIYTVNCGRSAEVIFLPFNIESGFSGHISEFYIQKFIDSNFMEFETFKSTENDILVKPHPGDIDQGLEILRGKGLQVSRPIVIIHPGSGGKNKCWHLENFCRVAKLLMDMGIEVVFLLGPAELERFNSLDIAAIEATAKCINCPSLNQVVQLISCASGFLGNDSGITHLAGAMGIPTATVFGPSAPAVYKPIGPRVKVYKPPLANFGNPQESSQHQVAEIILEMLED